MTSLSLDSARWPLAICSIAGRLGDDEFLRLTAWMDECIERGVHVTVLDLRENVGVDVRHLRRMARWLNQNHQRLSSSRSGTVLVLKAGFMRAAVDLVFRLTPGSIRYAVCASPEEAEVIARTMMVEASASAP